MHSVLETLHIHALYTDESTSSSCPCSESELARCCALMPGISHTHLEPQTAE